MQLILQHSTVLYGTRQYRQCWVACDLWFHHTLRLHVENAKIRKINDKAFIFSSSETIMSRHCLSSCHRLSFMVRFMSVFRTNPSIRLHCLIVGHLQFRRHRLIVGQIRNKADHSIRPPVGTFHYVAL